MDNKKLSPQQVFEQVRTYRFKNHMKVDEFCKLAGISPATIYAWQRTKKMRPDTFERVRAVIEGKQ